MFSTSPVICREGKHREDITGLAGFSLTKLGAPTLELFSPPVMGCQIRFTYQDFYCSSHLLSPGSEARQMIDFIRTTDSEPRGEIERIREENHFEGSQL
jgi:hypothetical protein